MGRCSLASPGDANGYRSRTRRPRGWRQRAARRGLSVLVACVAVLAFGPLAVAQATTPTGSIEGTVKSLKAHKALENIEVSALDEATELETHTTTNSEGKYTLPALATGDYTLTFASSTGAYVETEQRVKIKSEAEPTQAEEVLMQESSSLSGRVTSAATGAGIANVSVEVSGESGEYFTKTEADGDYSISGIVPGSYVVEFSRGTEYLSQSVSVTLGEGVPRELDAVMQVPGKITGAVTSAATHGALEKIDVYAFDSNGDYSGFAVTNASGEYTISGLVAGSYKLEFSWGFSEAEYKECEKAPRCIPRYITQYFNDQTSEATANPVGVAQGATSAGINAAMVPSAPLNTALPAVSGTSTVGSPLSCTSGSWTGEPELPLVAGWPLTSTFGYQWLLEATPIAGATSDAFVIQAADVGHGLVCEVTATNAAGHASAKSATFAVVKPTPVVKIVSSGLIAFRGKAKISISCASAACAGAVRVVETTVTRHRKGHRTIVRKVKLVVASGSYSLAAGKTGTITLHLTRAGAHKLSHARHHHLAPKAVVSVTGGKQVERAVQLRLAVRR